MKIDELYISARVLYGQFQWEDKQLWFSVRNIHTSENTVDLESESAWFGAPTVYCDNVPVDALRDFEDNSKPIDAGTLRRLRRMAEAEAEKAAKATWESIVPMDMPDRERVMGIVRQAWSHGVVAADETEKRLVGLLSKHLKS